MSYDLNVSVKLLHFSLKVGKLTDSKNSVYLFIYFYAAAYFVLVATIAALIGQHVVRRIIAILGRASIIIFILAFTIFVSAISLGTFHDFDWKS